LKASRPDAQRHRLTAWAARVAAFHPSDHSDRPSIAIEAHEIEFLQRRSFRNDLTGRTRDNFARFGKMKT
jgi:hypothetical protein